MGKHTYIAFYLSDTGGKFHLPYYGWDADTDHAACRRSTLLDTRLGAHSVTSTVGEIEAGRHSEWICERCAQKAVSGACVHAY